MAQGRHRSASGACQWLGGALLAACAAPVAAGPPAEAFDGGAAALAIVLLGLIALALALRLRAGRQALREARGERDLLRAMLDATPDAIFFKSVDGRYLACNSACSAALGFAPEDLLGKSSEELLPEAAAERLRTHDDSVLARGAPLRYRQRLTVPGRGPTHYETVKSPVRSACGDLIGLVGVARDVSSERQNLRRLKLASEVFDHASEGIIVTDPAGVIEAINPAFTRITGYSPEEMIGARPNKLASGRQDAAFYAAMWSALLGSGQWQGEIWNRRKSGEIYAEWLNISAVRDEEGRLEHYVGIFSDITPIKSHEAKLDHMAHHDALTDLPNRVLLTDRMELAMRRAAREHELIGIVFIDLDRFKHINDVHGHGIGDMVLQGVARRIAGALRDGDTVARIGGDEFVALLEDIDSAEAADHAAHRIFASLEAPLPVAGREFQVGASIGISLFPRDGHTIQELIRKADAAMYRAKERGRDGVAPSRQVQSA